MFFGSNFPWIARIPCLRILCFHARTSGQKCRFAQFETSTKKSEFKNSHRYKLFPVTDHWWSWIPWFWIFFITKLGKSISHQPYSTYVSVMSLVGTFSLIFTSTFSNAKVGNVFFSAFLGRNCGKNYKFCHEKRNSQRRHNPCTTFQPLSRLEPLL